MPLNRKKRDKTSSVLRWPKKKVGTNLPRNLTIHTTREELLNTEFDGREVVGEGIFVGHRRRVVTAVICCSSRRRRELREHRRRLQVIAAEEILLLRRGAVDRGDCGARERERRRWGEGGRKRAISG